MAPNPRTLRVHLDTNIYYSIRQTRFPADYHGQFEIGHEDLQLVLEKTQNGGIMFYEAPSNLIEVLRKINTDNIGIKRLLEISRELNEDRILMNPKDLVRDKLNTKHGTSLRLSNVQTEFLNIRDRVIADEPSNPWVVFDEYEKLATKVIAAINAFRPEFISSVFEVYCGAFNEDRYKVIAQQVIESADFRGLLKAAVVDRFGLGDIDATIKANIDREPFYELFSTYYIAMLKKVVHENKALEVNDYLDEEQVIYIDDLDLFVAVDRRFANIYRLAFAGSQRADKFLGWDDFVSTCKALP